MSIPRTTHQWLQALYDRLEGKSSQPLNLGSPTGLLGFYGATGVARLATGTAGITGWTGAGATSAFTWINGGSGTYYTPSDVVLALKNVGILKP